MCVCVCQWKGISTDGNEQPKSVRLVRRGLKGPIFTIPIFAFYRWNYYRGRVHRAIFYGARIDKFLSAVMSFYPVVVQLSTICVQVHD